MKISEEGLNLITTFEGLYGKAYRCPAGVWTIGYGHTGTVDGKKICSGMVITKKKAKELLQKDMNVFEKAVKECVKVKLNQHQFDALVSFAFNCGSGALKSSTLLKELNKGHYGAAADEFLKWNKGGGRVLVGLTRRREAEKRLFSRPMPKKASVYSFRKFVKQLEAACGLPKTGSASTKLLNKLPKISAHVNSTHPVIKPLKKILKKKGYNILKIDAKWSADLQDAVILYKKSHTIGNTTQECGSKFWKKILKL